MTSGLYHWADLARFGVSGNQAQFLLVFRTGLAHLHEFPSSVAARSTDAYARLKSEVLV